MRHNLRKTNQSIMYGVMAMAVVVLLTVMLFCYIWLDKTSPKEATEDSVQQEQYDE